MMITDIKRLREIGSEQPLCQLVCFAMLLGELRQLVCIMGVRCDDAVHVILQSDLCGL
ncbi:hypothetical protein D3C77_685540 [compost metagenome]